MIAVIAILGPGFAAVAASGVFDNGVPSLFVLYLPLALVSAVFWTVLFVPFVAGWQWVRRRRAAGRTS
jgi:hypothetical protein